MNHHSGLFEEISDVASSAGDLICHPTSMLFMKLSVSHRATQVKVWCVRKRREICFMWIFERGREILFNEIKHSPGTLMMRDGYRHLLREGKKEQNKIQESGTWRNLGGIYKVEFNKRKKEVSVFVLFIFVLGVFLYTKNTGT